MFKKSLVALFVLVGTTLYSASLGYLEGGADGISYIAKHKIGIVKDGKFLYNTGFVTFKLGGITIGTAKASKNLTLLDLVKGAKDEKNPTVTNITRFLQSIDKDNDNSNGIEVSKKVRKFLKNKAIDFYQSIEDFQKDQNVIKLLAKISSINKNSVNTLKSVKISQKYLRNILLAQYAGNWGGVFSGGDKGFVKATVDKNGNFKGSGNSTLYGISFTLQGKISSNGNANLRAFPAGSASTTAVFSGVVTPISGSGNWTNAQAQLAGTWNVSKK